MGQTALVSGELEAGADLAREFDKLAPVSAAFWLKASDASRRYLYLASEQTGPSDRTIGYRAVARLLTEIDSPFFFMYPVKLVAVDNPLVRAAIDYQTRSPNQAGIWLRDCPFGDVFADDVYIYPNPLPAAVT